MFDEFEANTHRVVYIYIYTYLNIFNYANKTFSLETSREIRKYFSNNQAIVHRMVVKTMRVIVERKKKYRSYERHAIKTILN